MHATVCVEAQQGASYEQILAVTRAAERAGFEGFFLSDHYLRMGSEVGGVDGLPGPSDAWITLAGLARETTSIRLGTLVSCATFRLPVPLAISVAQVDSMSAGRVTFGLGAGWFEDEHRTQGIPFPPIGERFDRLEEQLAIITGFWRSPVGDTFSFAGRHYQLDASPALPKPAQRPGPPVIVGGKGKNRTPVLAATFADEFNAVFLAPEETTQQFDRVRRACDDIGRDPSTLRLSAGAIICCGANRAEVRRRAEAIGLNPADLPPAAVCGAPDEVVARLAEWAECGADLMHLEIDDITDLDHLALLGEEVLPRLAQLG